MKEVLKIATNRVKRYMLEILICSIISSFLMINLIKFISYLIDGVIMNTSTLPQYLQNSFYSNDIQSKLIVLTIYMIVFIIIISISNYIKSMFSTKLKLSMNKNLRIELLNHTTYLEYMDYINYEKNKILQRVSSDTNAFVDFFIDKYNLVVDSIFTLIFSRKVVLL